MAIPSQLAGRLAIPAIVAPMFLVSGPDLVVECCRAGLLGTFPALNQRSSAGFAAWLEEIEGRLGSDDAPFGVNLIVHKSNPRVRADLEICVAHKVPLVITSLGAAREVVEAVHGYGGLVFHDVISTRHARKAADAGVDGIIAVAAGAGGHAGTLSPFALLSEIRSFFGGAIALSGAMSRGEHIAAAELMGADYGYLGSLFVAAEESLADAAYKEMMVGSQAADVLYTPNISGVHANFLRPSLVANGLDPDNLPAVHAVDMANEAKAWKTVWSAGHGVGGIDAVRPTRAICDDLIAGYRAAGARPS
jgi:nitronate monooxygenase